MTNSNRIPPDVDDKAARLLERAYSLKDDADTHDLYKDWAETYDKTMLDGLGYLSPKLVAALLATHVDDKSACVLDVGCGTGLAGVELSALGFETIDALDFSQEMLNVADKRKIYRKLTVADLTKPLNIPDATYDAAVCSGTFTHGHVGPECFSELFRIIKPNGLFAFSVNAGVWDEMGFGVELERLESAGVISLVERREGINYQTSSTPDSWLNVYARN
jgi:predicted TPR repeat methyltransferase